MDIRLEIGGNIRRLRKAKGLKQKELAALADYPRGYMCGVELGKHMAHIKTLLRIAAVLDVHISDLFKPLPDSE